MHEKWMALALEQAQKAYAQHEVPIGAIIVKNDQLLGTGFNQVETQKDPAAHAEIIAIREAAKKHESWRLNGATLYVSLEPCPMCLGALHLARLNHIVFATSDPRFGACGSYIDLTQFNAMTTPFTVESGILAEQSRALLQSFFSELRSSKTGP